MKRYLKLGDSIIPADSVVQIDVRPDGDEHRTLVVHCSLGFTGVPTKEAMEILAEIKVPPSHEEGAKE